jgi:1-aminocyclopropane-1-carboxylate deaminase/D-cysteine desulfhydrase-like pyridoxal-dependent ACC family enzyme
MNINRERKLEQAIAGLPRVALGVRPTPLEAMPRLSKALGGPPLYIKRDDLTGLAFGGNKTRMLELSLADALEKGADTIVTGAAVQSNYCRQMAAACAKLDLDLHLIMRPVRPIDREEVQGNHFLQRLFGAHITILEDRDRAKQQAVIAAKAEELRAAGKTVYIPRQPDTVDLDVIAYAESALEIVRQCRELEIEPAYLYVTALDTTQAGLVLGLAYLESPIYVRGFSPTDGVPDRSQRMAKMANQAARRLGLHIELNEADFDNDDRFVGERYGIPTRAGLDALRTVARMEGILLDPVYTSKAMSALIEHIREGRLANASPVIFVHTGGAPALFGYVEDVLQALQRIEYIHP